MVNIGDVQTSGGVTRYCIRVSPEVWVPRPLRAPKVTYGLGPHTDAQDMDGWLPLTGDAADVASMRRVGRLHVFMNGGFIDQGARSSYVAHVEPPAYPFPGLRWRVKDETKSYFGVILTYTEDEIWQAG